jgi:hypothetical protein
MEKGIDVGGELSQRNASPFCFGRIVRLSHSYIYVYVCIRSCYRIRAGSITLILVDVLKHDTVWVCVWVWVCGWVWAIEMEGSGLGLGWGV